MGEFDESYGGANYGNQTGPATPKTNPGLATPYAGGNFGVGVDLSGGAAAPTLSPLTLSTTNFPTGLVAGTVLATISGKTAGSTVSIAPSDTSGVFSVNGAGTQLLVGLNYSSAAAGSRNAVLSEALSGATNSPNTTTVGVTLAAAAIPKVSPLIAGLGLAYAGAF